MIDINFNLGKKPYCAKPSHGFANFWSQRNVNIMILPNVIILGESSQELMNHHYRNRRLLASYNNYLLETPKEKLLT